MNWLKNKKEVSVNVALKRGHYLINYPILFMFLVLFIVFIIGERLEWSAYIYLALGIGAFCGSWLWWSYWITKWKIWAFTNVRNVHELKAKAIDQKLIWPDYSIFNKTEIRNAKQKQELENLEKKFKVHDIILAVEDDGSVPSKVEIYNSRALKIFYSVLIVGAISGSIYELLQAGYGMACLYFIIAVIIFWPNKSFLFDFNPKIIFTPDKFIVSNEFEHEWERLLSAMLRTEGFGNNSSIYIELQIKRKGKKGPRTHKLNLEQLSASPNKIEFLFKLFQHRANLRRNKEMGK